MERAIIQILLAGENSIEDQALNTFFLRLLPSDYDCNIISDFDRAIDHITQYMPDCLLINGDPTSQTTLTFIEKARLIDANIGIILLTDSQHQPAVAKALEKGANHYLIKERMSVESLRLSIFENRHAINRQNNTENTDKAKPNIIPNLDQFFEILTHSINLAKQQQRLLAVVFCQFDLQAIGITTEQQSDFLTVLAQHINSTVRKVDAVAIIDDNRIGVLLRNIHKLFDSNIIISRIFQSVSHFKFLGDTINLQLKIGITHFPLDGDRAEALINNVNTALSKIKNEQNNALQNFCEIEDHALDQEALVTNDMNNAIDNNEFYLVYQPIFNLVTNSMIGLEALLRWEHPKLGVISPNNFIPLAEKNGLIIPIGNWVFEQACRQYQQWCTQGIDPGCIYINVSVFQLGQANFAKILKTLITQCDIKPSNISIELTDIALVDNVKGATKTLNQLHKLGFQISIDDFGCGFSSMNYFDTIPADTVKIDQVYTAGIPHNPSDVAITNAIVTLTKKLDAKVVAEGIERKEQLDFLVSNKCEYGQGFLLCQPLTVDNVTDFVRSTTTNS